MEITGGFNWCFFTSKLIWRNQNNQPVLWSRQFGCINLFQFPLGHIFRLRGTKQRLVPEGGACEALTVAHCMLLFLAEYLETSVNQYVDRSYRTCMVKLGIMDPITYCLIDIIPTYIIIYFSPNFPDGESTYITVHGLG